MGTTENNFGLVYSAIASAEEAAEKWLMGNVFSQQNIYETIYPVIKSVEDSVKKGQMGDGMWYSLEAYISNSGNLKINFANEINRKSRIEYIKNRAVIFWHHQGYDKVSPESGFVITENDISEQVEAATKVICSTWEIEM